MVEKDIEVNEREITEMEEEFLNIEKLQADGYNEAEGPRYLSQSSVHRRCPHRSVNVLRLNGLMTWAFVQLLQRDSLLKEYTYKTQ